MIKGGEYRYFSPEWTYSYIDTESGIDYGATLLAGGLTNRPFFKGMASVMCSEQILESEDLENLENQELEKVETKSEETVVQSELEITEVENKPVETPQVIEASEKTESIVPTETDNLKARLVAAETELAVLKAAETRRNLNDEISAMVFSEKNITPASKTELVDALMDIPSGVRPKLINAIKNLKFAELGEKGFVAQEPENTILLSASEEKEIIKMSELYKVPVQEAKQKYIELKSKRIN
jgi:hypothetical protein